MSDERLAQIYGSKAINIAQDSTAFSNAMTGKVSPTALVGSVAGAVDKTTAEVLNPNLPKLAQPVYTTGSTTNTAVADVYGKQLNSPQNKIVSVLSGAISDLTDMFGKFVNNPDVKFAAQTALQVADIAANFDKDKVKERLKSYKNNFIAGVVAQGSIMGLQMADNLANKYGSTLNGILGINQTANYISDLLKDTPKLKILYDGVATLVDGDYDSADGIMKTIDKITAKDSVATVFDMETEFAIFHTVTQEALRYDIPAMFDKLMGRFTTPEEKIVYVSENIIPALSKANFGFIEKALTEVSGDYIKRQTPDAIETLISGFQPTTLTPEMVTRLNNVLNQIDPNWNKYNRDGVMVTNLSAYSAASAPALQALLQDPEHRVAVMLSGSYQQQDIIENMQQKYPHNMIDPEAKAWADMEITATTKQTKTAEQVLAELAEQQAWADLEITATTKQIKSAEDIAWEMMEIK